VSCDYRAGVASDGAQPYTVQCLLCPPAVPDDEVVDIQVTFDRYFVPRALGLNSDERELVAQLVDVPELEPSIAGQCQTQAESQLPGAGR
jgi:hypothetical protein